ncbi:glycerophosphodiester phosphodiesterase family protein [Thalassovita mediterranea]|jgi:glycerophosphoryl diester phosphodiesterase|uniref:Glycerophosphoryl diester phosphodiesterase n=1 Tax=Thalassovita mediterranea TaxID=340021 RepID=A0A0P1GRH7_9RHOB|nr:glycerophosphodiester phosphodiesterase family protein [Thalassovita mediterranea]CUH85198.1 Glycerophosphoryl diester phosphodiesterase [Thalassovita mediterranea]SIS30762.1 Glycerophosphoryl diester phosphodiesterase [Thalassovita mediterranea]
MTKLPAAFLKAPIAHRALHDVTAGRAENSPAAIQAAIDAGYGIEIDLQLSKDGEAMVFHDYDMERLAGVKGVVQTRTAAELSQIQLLGGTDRIPTLSQVLDQVAGQVPLLIEVKDQDGQMGANVGRLEAATAKALEGYQGDVALMSFNPNSVRVLSGLCPDRARGLTTAAYNVTEWPMLPKGTREKLARIPDYDAAKCSFISHDARDLNSARVAELKQRGAHVLCWTITSAAAEAEARKVAENVTFEGYLAAQPAA